MAKKKVKRLNEEERAALAEARKQKAEAKEQAAAKKSEMASKKKQWTIYAAILIGGALILSLFGLNMFGPDYYFWANLASFVLMACAGLCLMQGSKFESDKKKSDRNHFTGLAFAALSAMMIVTQLIQHFLSGTV